MGYDFSLSPIKKVVTQPTYYFCISVTVLLFPKMTWGFFFGRGEAFRHNLTVVPQRVNISASVLNV